jgi:hypothetical protein
MEHVEDSGFNKLAPLIAAAQAAITGKPVTLIGGIRNCSRHR